MRSIYVFVLNGNKKGCLDFSMITPQQNKWVVHYLKYNSKRPLSALELWAALFENVNHINGQVMKTREELAHEIGILPRNISTIMSELEHIDVVFRKKEGRKVTYYINPNICIPFLIKTNNTLL